MAKTTAKANTIVPLGDRVLVKRLEADEVTKGGIILPDSAKEKPREAKVISVGEGQLNDEGKRTPLTVKKGDRILFSAYGGTEIKVDGEDYMILSEDEVLAIIE
ncbi:MAG: co-chaperone GroES [Planctomycetota bacterium]|jgi:chaperonin GroES